MICSECDIRYQIVGGDFRCPGCGKPNYPDDYEPPSESDEPAGDSFPDAGSFVSQETMCREAWDAKFGVNGTHRRNQ